jgi:hypothetical protein
LGRLDKAHALMRTFGSAAGVNCFVVDMTAKGIPPGGGCDFCTGCYTKQQIENGRARCENLMEYAVVQSERWGGKYEFLCPAGAAFIAAPGLNQGMLEYGLAVGPFLMVSTQDFIDEGFGGLFSGSTKDIASAAKQLLFIEPNAYRAGRHAVYDHRLCGAPGQRGYPPCGADPRALQRDILRDRGA